MKDALHALCPSLSPEQLDLFAAYYALLLDWNTRMNLTAVTEKQAVAEKHFFDSLAAAPLLPKNAVCVDAGTGAGFPGVPLLIARPDIRVTLMDSLEKRLRFLDEALHALGLADRAKTAHLRAEDAGHDASHRGRYDVALTRAVAALPVIVELTVPLVKVGGRSIAYKGAAAGQELAAAKGALHLLHAHAEAVPVSAAYGERALIVITKDAPTPKQYPRKAGTPAKNPL